MGINGLWKTILPLAKIKSLTQLITAEAIARRTEGKGLPVIGVDASPLMFAAKGAAHAAVNRGGSWARVGRESELACLRLHVEQWLRLPAIFVVIFDGRGRPSAKRGKNVRTKEHQLAAPFRQILDAVGFYHHTAPGEGEAFLALLNKAGRIDYALTSDSDIFMFGAIRVIRVPRDTHNRDVVEVYDQSALLAHDARALCPAGLVFIATLAGGDYDKEGLKGCSFQTAFKLAQSSLPQELVRIFQRGNTDDYEVSEFLSVWRKSLHFELSEGPHLDRHFPSVAASLSQTFPQPRVVDQYVNPVVGSQDLVGVPHWALRFPDSVSATRLAQGLFRLNWVQVRGFLRRSVWPGYAIRHLLTAHTTAGAPSTCSGCLDSHLPPRISSLTAVMNTGPTASFFQCSVRIGIASVEPAVASAYIQASGGTSESVRNTSTTTIEIPAAILLYTMPDVLEAFCRSYPLHRAHLARCKRELQELQPAKKVQEVIDITDPVAGPSHYTVTESTLCNILTFGPSGGQGANGGNCQVWTLRQSTPSWRIAAVVYGFFASYHHLPILFSSFLFKFSNMSPNLGQAARQGGRAQARARSGDMPSLDDLDYNASQAAINSRKASNTVKKYRSYKAQTRQWFANVVASERRKAEEAEKRRQDPSVGPDNSTADSPGGDDPDGNYHPPKRSLVLNPDFVNCLDEGVEPNEFVTEVLCMMVWDKCGVGKCGIGVAQMIISGWKDEFDNRETPHGRIWQGEWHWDEAAGAFRGNPARCDRIREVLHAVKVKPDQKPRKHSRAMTYDNMVSIWDYLQANLASVLHRTDRASIGKQCKNLFYAALSSVGFVIWTRNSETINLKWKHINFNAPPTRGQNGQLYPKLVVNIRYRKNWEHKLETEEVGLEGHIYNIYKQQDKPAIDLYENLTKWKTAYETHIIGRAVQPEDYVFPNINFTNLTAHPDVSITRQAVGNMIKEMAEGAGLPKHETYTTHCFRRGGAQYRFMFAPIGERWELDTIQWWGGWAEQEKGDTLIRYLLDELRTYEEDRSDALLPGNATSNSHMGEDRLLRPFTASDGAMLTEQCTQTIKNEVAKAQQNIVTSLVEYLAYAGVPQGKEAYAFQPSALACNAIPPTRYTQDNHRFSSPACNYRRSASISPPYPSMGQQGRSSTIPSNPSPRLVEQGPGHCRAMASDSHISFPPLPPCTHTYQYCANGFPQPTYEQQPQLSGSNPGSVQYTHTIHHASSVAGCTTSYGLPQPPLRFQPVQHPPISMPTPPTARRPLVARYAVPTLSRTALANAWRVVVDDWEKLQPQRCPRPLKDWPPSWYKETKQAQAYHIRKVIATEFIDEYHRDDNAFCLAYPAHARGMSPLYHEIRAARQKRGEVKTRARKNRLVPARDMDVDEPEPEIECSGICLE
ncbi:hypothetical protein NMY22_g9926 [Coprinellus aureogranulatus]|nr:hypothetical protein NMY22_g9926 [Coprinellus aureogranulatus]